MPIYTKIFTPSDYGDLIIINNATMILGLLSTFALDSAAHRFYYDSDDYRKKIATFSNWFWFQLVITFFLLLICILFLPSLDLIYIVNAQHTTLFLIVGVTLIFNILPNILTNWYRVNLNSRKTVIFTSIYTLISILFNIFFVLILKMGILGFFVSSLFVAFFSTVFAYFELKDSISYRYFDFQILKSMISYSLPLIPAAISYWILNNTNSFFLLYYLGKSQVGVFAIGASIASLMTFFTNSFQTAIGPFAFSIMNEKDCRMIYASIFDFYTYLSILLSFNLMFFAPEILRIFTQPPFYSASWVVGILGLNLILIGYSYIASIGNSIVKENKYYMYATFIAMILSALLNMLMIPCLGINGSALATLLSQLFIPVYLFYKSQQNFCIPYKFIKNSIFFTFACLFCVLFRLLLSSESLLVIAIKVSISLMFSSFLIYKAIKRYKSIAIL
jgi:O-antigen/teichoic acid export membrane protein